jgi:hypothetical protein
MNYEELITRLHEELEYTKLKSNIEKLYTFLTSDKSKDIKPYHRTLLEVQLNAMNIYHNTLVLRISGLGIDAANQPKEETKDENSTSNQ